MRLTISKISFALVLLLSQSGCSYWPNPFETPARPAKKIAAPRTYAGVAATVKKIASESLGVPANKINVNAPLAKQNIGDELDVVEIVMSVEEEYEIEIPDDEIGAESSSDPFAAYKTLSLQRLINITWRKVKK